MDRIIYHLQECRRLQTELEPHLLVVAQWWAATCHEVLHSGIYSSEWVVRILSYA